MDGSPQQIEANLKQYPLLFEILRSFTALAHSLNLSHAVRELGSTRQTVRRHIAQLEEMKGGPLFLVTDRQYELSELGKRILPEALDLQARAEAWVQGKSHLIDGMQYLRHGTDDGWLYFQQQHPIGHVFTSTGEILQDAIRAWTQAGGDIEHETMQPIRHKAMIFRRSEGNWLFTEVGEESSFTSWFGWATARSAVGRVLGQLPGGDSFDRLVNEAYAEVEQNQSARLDHCYTTLQNDELGGIVPICYERLLLGSRFADGSFAMLSVVRRTYDVEIKGVSDEMLRLMPEKMLM